eukprot:352061-Chlamydomonas_euryale.AAC.4
MSAENAEELGVGNGVKLGEERDSVCGRGGTNQEAGGLGMRGDERLEEYAGGTHERVVRQAGKGTHVRRMETRGGKQGISEWWGRQGSEGSA